MGVPISRISGLQLGSPGTKWHLNAGPMARHIEYSKGKGGGFLKSKLWWVLLICVCPWLVCAPKVLQLCTNQLVVWFMQVHVSNWLACHSCPHLGIPTRPSILKVLRARECALTLYPSAIFTSRFTIEYFKEFGGASRWKYC